MAALASVAAAQAFNTVLDSQAAIEQTRRMLWVGQPHEVLAQACAARQLQSDGEAQVLVERLVRQECEHDPRYYASKAEIWFQVGHVRELTQDYHAAKEAYERVLDENDSHAKALQQLGWLYHNIPNFSPAGGVHGAIGGGGAAAAEGAAGSAAASASAAEAGAGANQETAVRYLNRSIEANPSDDQAWYLLGRCYMTQREYTKAHKAYEKAVNINDRDPTCAFNARLTSFWSLFWTHFRSNSAHAQIGARSACCITTTSSITMR